MNNQYSADHLIGLIGIKRNDARINELIAKAPVAPEITVDNNDGAQDEFIEFKKLGFGLHFISDILSSVHFHDLGQPCGYNLYNGQLPMGLRFGQSKYEIIEILGKPVCEGGGSDDFFGAIPDWMKYKINNMTLHVKFGENDVRLNVVSIMNY